MIVTRAKIFYHSRLKPDLPSVAILLLIALLGFVGLAGAGCGSSVPQTRYYQLTISENGSSTQRGAAQNAGSGDLVLVLDAFGVDAAYDQTQMVYRESPYRIDSYYYQRWAALPGRLVSDAMRQGYQSTGLFKTVLAGQTMRADAVLSGHISAIEEVDKSAREWQGRVVVELRLRDGRTGTLLWTQVFDEVEPMPEQNPAGLASSVSRILERIVAESAPEIAQIAAQARSQP